MKKLLILPLFFISMHNAKAQTFNPLLSTMLQDTLNYYVSIIPSIKGMSASVYIPGQGTWKGTAGVSYTGQPINSDMQFGIASNTKLFVAAMMLKLAERNIISLNDPLSAWLPAYPNVNPNITIRQLLNHTSGISDPIFLAPWMDTINNNPTRVFTPNEVMSWVGAPLFPAGTSWGYSNINYVLAGMIAQNATGYHISRLIRDSILTPLNMDSTFYDVEETVPGTIAHRWWNSIDYHDTSRVGINTAGGAAGAIFSTSGEMAQWYRSLLGGQILNGASMTELTTFVTTSNPTMTYGLGISRETTSGKTYWGHGGSIWGYRSKIMYDTCLKSVVCGLSNSFPSGNDGVTFLLYRVILNHIPGCSGAITGPTTVTQGQTSVTYTVPPIPNATSYVWTLPSGATGTSSTNSITINYGMAAASGPITVQGVNLYGPGGSASLPIIVTTILPVKLTQFDAIKQGKYSLVTWTTASEENTERFILEYSTDGQSYSELSTVNAAGLSQTEKHYSYTHLSPSAGINYYRLKIIDADESLVYSKVRTLSYKCDESSVMIYPNPVAGELTINTTEPGKSYKFKILNATGQILYNTNVSGNARIPLHSYAPGIYFVKLETDQTVIVRKIIKK